MRAPVVAQMNMQRRIAILAGLWALAEIGAAWRTAEATPAVLPSICSRLAAHMRRSPAVVIGGRTVPNMLPWIVNASPYEAEQEPVYRFLAPKWRLPLPPTLESLPGTDLFMASRILGSGDCLNAMFFEWKSGSALRPVGDPGKSGPCGRLGQSGGLAAVLGQPAYVESEPLNPSTSGSVVHITPWRSSGWGPACHVSIQLIHQYPVRLRYCGSDRAVCSAARQVAPAVERRYETYSAEQLADFNEIGTFSFRGFFFQGTPTADGRALVSRARRMAMSRVTAAESAGAPSWLRVVIPADVAFFPLSLDDKLYVASATGGADPTELIRWILPNPDRYLGPVDPNAGRGALLVVYRAPSGGNQQLVPLAVIAMHSRMSGVKSIETGDDQAN